MNHLTPDELVDEVDQTLPADRRAHLDECEACRRQLDGLRRTLGELHATDVPEPSPLFWTHFSERVQQALDTEQKPRRTALPAWVGWRVAVPVAALALLVAMLLNAVPRDARIPDRSATDVSVSPLTGATDDELFDDASWQLVSDLTEDMDLDEESHAGFVVPGAIERAASALEPAERAELLRILRAELGRPES